ncbi:MAG: MBL fold metallo-hydrolase [Crenarchaeota archaeon]|nr:MBL fold metallo-hydrolase [Thermoproteota archaeon]
MNPINKNQEKKVYEINEADAVEILSLVDNSADFLSSINHKKARSFRQWIIEKNGKGEFTPNTLSPIAEHGFSMLIRIKKADKSYCILFDTGSSPEIIIENSKRMNIDLSEVDCIVLSHGHYDHFGGLITTLKAIGKEKIPLILHQGMLKKRGTVLPNGNIREYPDFPEETQLHSARLVFTKSPFLIADNMVCVTGEIPRKTSFEKGFMRHRNFVDNVWQPEPLIIDERALVMNIKGKGLIIITGCAHAGIINTVKYAQEISGIEQVYSIIGGFHLAGRDCEERIKPTIEELAQIKPKLIVPSHCTGWKAINKIIEALPEAFVWNSVGNLYEIVK